MHRTKKIKLYVAIALTGLFFLANNIACVSKQKATETRVNTRIHRIDIVGLDTVRFEKAAAKINYSYLTGVDTIIEVSNKHASAKLTIINDQIEVELICDSLEKVIKTQSQQIYQLYEEKYNSEVFNKKQKWYSSFIPGISVSLIILVIFILIKLKL